jgi:hypothetical protein|tara:strand:- start:441 stop:746 length:306 start_codon:yes stop_codon:yes gene_type:complete
MSAYASGQHALALCDRCGQEYSYLSLQKEWTGFKVCSECYEPKHPQLDPKPTTGDAQALYEPRVNRVEPLVVPVGENKSFPEVNEPLRVNGLIGIITVSTT